MNGLEDRRDRLLVAPRNRGRTYEQTAASSRCGLGSRDEDSQSDGRLPARNHQAVIRIGKAPVDGAGVLDFPAGERGLDERMKAPRFPEPGTRLRAASDVS